MATSTSTNRGAKYLADTDLTTPPDIRAGVITNAAVPTEATILDLDTVADLLAETGVTEAAAVGYARADLANVTAPAQDNANDRVNITADAPTFTTPAVGETWAAQFFYVEGANDAARILLGVSVWDTPLPTNGSDITGSSFEYQWNAA